MVIVNKLINKNKVNLICGGGSGHEPAVRNLFVIEI